MVWSAGQQRFRMGAFPAVPNGPSYGSNQIAAATAGDKALWVRTDIGGGQVQQVQGGAWQPVAAPVVHASQHAAAGSDPVTPAAIGAPTLTPAAPNVVQPTGPGVVPEVGQGAVGQTADLRQWQSSSGAVLARVSAAGDVTANGARVGNVANIGGYAGIANGALAPGNGFALVQGPSGDTYVNAASGQALNLRIANGSPSALSIASSGAVTIPNQLQVGAIAAVSATATSAPSVFKGAVSQVTDLSSWQASSGTVLAKVTPAGAVVGTKLSPMTMPAARTQSNWALASNALRTIDRNGYTLDNLFDYVATLVSDLQTIGLLA